MVVRYWSCVQGSATEGEAKRGRTKLEEIAREDNLDSTEWQIVSTNELAETVEPVCDRQRQSREGKADRLGEEI